MTYEITSLIEVWQEKKTIIKKWNITKEIPQLINIHEIKENKENKEEKNIIKRKRNQRNILEKYIEYGQAKRNHNCRERN